MAGAMMSPVFAGRGAELAALAGAFEEAAGGTPRTVLLGGEAGVGKSRLAGEFAARVRDRALVLAGGCVELSTASLPYAPFGAALRELVRERGTAEVAALLPGQAAGELAGLLPEFGSLPSGAEPSGADPATARARLFELLLALLEGLAERQPVLLIIEDLHWADPASCDLLSFLARNLRQAAVLVVGTFRSDGLHRDHPLRPVLAGLERMDGVGSLSLAPLARSDVAAQLAGIFGRPAAPSVIDAVWARGAGNPLFTEALVHRDGTVSGGLPWTLRELLAGAVKDLPEATQEVLRTAAVGGSRAGHALLAAVTGLESASLTGAVRPAVAANVLVSDGDGYAFRHQLIREAVLADLLPGERAQAHRRFASVLAPASGAGAAVAVARHWLGAGETSRALAAAWRAAGETGAAFAYAQRLQMLEQVLELWDQVPDAAAVTGSDRVGVRMLAADAARWAGQAQRGLELVEAGLAELDSSSGSCDGPGDGSRRAAGLLRRAGLRRELLLPGQLDELREALRLADAPSRVRAQVLAQVCWALRREDRHREAARLAGELRALADELGDEESGAEAEMLLAAIGALRGEDTFAALDRAREQAAGIGAGQLEAWAYLTASHVLAGRGADELAIQAGLDGLARARELGLARQVAAPIAGNLAESLAAAGRWDEALETLDEVLSLELPARGRIHPLLVRGTLAVARGDLAGAADALAAARALPAGLWAEAQCALPLARLEIEYRLASGDLAGAVALAGAMPGYGPETDPRYPWALLVTAMRAGAEVSVAGLPVAGLAQLRTDLARRAAAVPQVNPLHRAYAATFAAEAGRSSDGAAGVASWDAAAAAWDSLGQPYPAAYALLRAAGAGVAGDREGAGVRLARAASLARRVGAVSLEHEIGQLARRARIQLPGVAAAGGGAPFGLTGREQEVLRLVAAGKGNREIAAELFISPRTASVHVSNILSKLRVASRGEAAATAHRLHLFD